MLQTCTNSSFLFDNMNMVKPYHLFKYILRDGDNFTAIAHRGASAYFPENTIPSFEGAIAMGADMVELDVQLASDKEVVVFHDENLSRCTDGRGRIADHTLAQLKKLDAGIWYDKKFQNTRIPTLAEALGVCKNKIAVNIEIKTEAVSKMFFGGIEEKCLKIVEQSGMNGHVVFSSFDPRAIMHLKQIDNKVTVAVLFEKKHYDSKLPSDIINSVGADAFNCSISNFKKEWLTNIKSNNIPVNIYTVNDAENMRRFLDMGISGIFTNNPDILKRVAEDVKKKQLGEGR
jgi:glycerophosphoryl diester phosphodiesterase